MTIAFPEHAWPLFKRALQHIADHPEEFWMGTFVSTIEDAHETYRTGCFMTHPPTEGYNACGTVACLAGRVVLEHDADMAWLNEEDPFFEHLAFRALGVAGADHWELRGHLESVFYSTHIAQYDELRDELNERFTFPEPLPQPTTVTA